MSVFQVVHLQTWLNQEIRNTFYYQTVVGDPSDSEWQDIVDEIRADLVTLGLAARVDSWEFYGIDRRRVDVAGLLSFRELPTLGDAVGTKVIDSVPTQVACLVSNKGSTVKPNRARSYLGGFGEDQVDASIWDASVIAYAENLIDLQSDLNAAGTNNLQRVSAQWNTSHTLVTAWNDISGAASKASIVPATQRRRRIGVGI